METTTIKEIKEGKEKKKENKRTKWVAKIGFYNMSNNLKICWKAC
jgi:hypothetical protein